MSMLHVTGLQSNCVITAAHALTAPGDAERFGDSVEVLLSVQGTHCHTHMPTVGVEYVLQPQRPLQWATPGGSRACDAALVQFSEPSCGGEVMCSLVRATAFHLAWACLLWALDARQCSGCPSVYTRLWPMCSCAACIACAVRHRPKQAPRHATTAGMMAPHRTMQVSGPPTSPAPATQKSPPGSTGTGDMGGS